MEVPDSNGPRTADRQSALECLNSAQCDLRKLVEHWNDRLTFETCDIAKAYVDGWLALVVNMKLAGSRHSYHAYCAALIDASGTPPHGEASTARHFNISVEVHQLPDAEYWDQQHVLIGNIQTIQHFKKRVPSCVTFHRISEQRNNVVRSLQYSLTERVYKFFSVFPDPEIGPFARCFPESNHEFNVGKIERSPEIVKSVPQDEGQFFGRLFGESEIEAALAGIRISFNIEHVEVSIEEGVKHIIEINDVLIGPFDL